MSSDEQSVADLENDLEVVQDDEAHFENIETERQHISGEEINENEEDTEDKTKKPVKPKRVIKNPRPKLNTETLKGPRGLSAIEGYFDRVKFKGRGCEEEDLNVLMKTYEYWCHRLFPKFPFDNCIEKLEKLGTMKATQVQVKKIRMGLNFEEDKEIVSDEEQIETDGFVDLLDDQFNQLSANMSRTDPEMNEEQLERIHQNRERAQKLQQERLSKIREKAEYTLERSNKISQLNPVCNEQNGNTSNVKFNDGNLSNQTEINDQNRENEEVDIENEEVDIEVMLDDLSDDDTSFMKKSSEVVNNKDRMLVVEDEDYNHQKLEVYDDKINTNSNFKSSGKIDRPDKDIGNILGDINMDSDSPVEEVTE